MRYVVIYTVPFEAHDYCLYDSYNISKEFSIHSATLNLSLNEPGTFAFNIANNHAYYDKLRPFFGEVIVYEDDDRIFTGRIISISTDLYGTKTVSCEGEMSYLGDTTQDYFYYANQSNVEIFKSVVNKHNEKIKSFNTDNAIDKAFKIGDIQVAAVTDETEEYRKKKLITYVSTLSALKSNLLDLYGGHLCVTHETDENGKDIRILNWHDHHDTANNQKIIIGKNAKSYNFEISYQDYCTAIMPLGDQYDIQWQKEDVGEKNRYNIMGYSVFINGFGQITCDGGYVWDWQNENENGYSGSTDGLIIKSVIYDGIKTQSALFWHAVEDLKKYNAPMISVNVDVIDMHLIDPSKNKMKLGSYYTIEHSPFGEYRMDDLRLIGIKLNLTDASASSYTFGNKEKRLTDMI